MRLGVRYLLFTGICCDDSSELVSEADRRLTVACRAIPRELRARRDGCDELEEPVRIPRPELRIESSPIGEELADACDGMLLLLRDGDYPASIELLCSAVSKLDAHHYPDHASRVRVRQRLTGLNHDLDASRRVRPQSFNRLRIQHCFCAVFIRVKLAPEY